MTSMAHNKTLGGIARYLACGVLYAASFAGAAAPADNPPGDAIGVIEGEAISVDGPMTVEVVRGQVKTVLRSGSDVHVKAGQARIDLVEGGQIMICGPAHFSMLKAGGAITLALDSGTAINPSSLRLKGSTLSWRHGGHKRMPHLEAD